MTRARPRLSLDAGAQAWAPGAADGATGRFVTTFNVGCDATIWAIAPVAGGGFATGDSRGHVLVWDPETATVLEDFHVHQADVLVLAASGDALHAAGIDPTLATFVYTARTGKWAHAGHNRFHVNDVTGLAVGARGRVVSASRDATLWVDRKVVLPFQNRPPVAAAARGDAIIVVGGAGPSLAIWRVDGARAHKEARLGTRDGECWVQAVAISGDGCRVAYAASHTRSLRYEGDQWAVGAECAPPATALCFSQQGALYRGARDGELANDTGGALNVGFPVFRIAVSTDGETVCAGGLASIVLLGPELDGVRQRVPELPTPFCTFAFQPDRNRLFISSGHERLSVYDTKKQVFITRMALKLKKSGTLGVNAIAFDPKNSDRVVLASSKRAFMTNLMRREAGFFRFPYGDILHLSLVAPDKIVIYEKPWVLFARSLPRVFRAKRFQTNNEDQLPRY